MTQQEFQKLLEEKTKLTQDLIYDRFTKSLSDWGHDYLKTAVETMDYSFMAGGKRLRPLMMREVYLAFRGNAPETEELKSFMTALEMIPTYSLVHDDLPAMDNDEYRRGKKTTWKVYGDGMAVLAGDGLLNGAYEIAFGTIKEALAQGKSSEELLRIAKCGELLSENAGLLGMLGGQFADVEAEKKNLSMDLDEIYFIHERKTAALIRTAMGIGALLGGASEEERLRIDQVATKVGIAFQIQDDLLDVIGDSAVLGKSVGSDAQSGKETFVTLKGIEASKAEVKRLSEEATLILETLPGDKEFLKELILHLIYRNK